MADDQLPKQDSALLRLLALAGAAGAALSAGFSAFSAHSIWASIALVAALLATAGIAGMWRASSRRNVALHEAVLAKSEQKREMGVLQQELDTHRQLERDLTAAKQTAEAAMMAKGEFLATMSHEIRTPLNGIIPMLDLLASSALQSDQQDILRTAHTSAMQMQRIVDDILDYSKLEANKFDLETTSFNLRELCDSILRLMEKQAESKGLHLSMQIDPAVRLPMRGDPVRLRQILTNLVSNALKFTSRGSITLIVSRRGETRTQHELRFEVRDTGIGIAKENTSRLFKAFSQADASTTRLYGGTGLGLVICKRIVELMGGTIGVESELGRGSTFWFEVPMLKASGDVRGLRTDLDGAKLLFLCTEATLRQRVEKATGDWGAQLAISDSTQDTLNRLRSALGRGPTWSFDMLVVDLNSVKATAVALHRNLRRTPEFEDLRVVFLQGTDPLPVELANTAGLQVFARTLGNAELRTLLTGAFSKPIVRAEAAAMTMETPAIGTTAAAGVAALSKTRQRGRLLLVEDNPVNLMVAQRLIGLTGFSCETADNGEVALERLVLGNLDLVLMDCQMPIKDGYTATREWRAHEAANQLPRLPIIAMTANAMAGDRQKCLDAGMDDYLSKPVDRRLLEAALSRWLAVRLQQTLGLESQAAPLDELEMPLDAATAPVPPHGRQPAPPMMQAQFVPMSTPATIVSRPLAAPISAAVPTRPLPQAPSTAAATEQIVWPPSMPRPAQSNTTSVPIPSVSQHELGAAATPLPPVLDDEVIEELRSVMGPEYHSLISLFLADAPTLIEQLEAAAAAEDIPAMVAPAHTLKSSSANLGAMALSASAKRIELGARTGKLPRPTIAVVLLETEFRKAQTALQRLPP